MFGVHYFKTVANFSLVNEKDVSNKTFIIFLRDPYKRWLSSVAQWFVNYLPENTIEYTIDPLMMKLIFSAVSLDGHGYPQLDFFNHLKWQKNYVFFNIDDPYFEIKLKYFSQHKMNLRFPKGKLPKVNEAEGNSLKKSILNQIIKFADENPEQKNKVMLYYCKDFDLLKATHFYQNDSNWLRAKN